MQTHGRASFLIMSDDSDSGDSLWSTLQGPRNPLPPLMFSLVPHQQQQQQPPSMPPHRYAVTCRMRVTCTVVVAAHNEDAARERAEYDLDCELAGILYRLSAIHIPDNDGETEYDVVQVADNHECVLIG